MSERASESISRMLLLYDRIIYMNSGSIYAFFGFVAILFILWILSMSGDMSGGEVVKAWYKI